MTILQRVSFQTSLLASTFMTGGVRALAQDTFGRPIPEIPGTPTVDDTGSEGIREAILDVVIFVLNFLALLAIIFIIIAGIRLIVSQGEDEQKDKAKKTIIYVIVGLLVILFARVIVGFFTQGVQDIIE